MLEKVKTRLREFRNQAPFGRSKKFMQPSVILFLYFCKLKDVLLSKVVRLRDFRVWQHLPITKYSFNF